MTGEEHHVELVQGISEQLKTILDKSEQAIYIYLDDTHKNCNKKFASLLGYNSVKQWVDAEAPLADVVKADQKKVVAAYEKAMGKMAASSLDIKFKNIKTGEEVKANMIMVPMLFNGHLFAVHFLSKI